MQHSLFCDLHNFLWLRLVGTLKAGEEEEDSVTCLINYCVVSRATPSFSGSANSSILWGRQLKGNKVSFVVRSKVVLFMFLNGFLKIFFDEYLSLWCLLLELVLDLMISKLFIYTKNEDDLSFTSYLLRLKYISNV